MKKKGFPLNKVKWSDRPAVWLLSSGRFLLIRPVHYYSWETGMEWRGEPTVFEDPPTELLSNIDKACYMIRWNIMLHDVGSEDVESHQEDLLYILNHIGSQFIDDATKLISHLSPKSMSKYASKMVDYLIQNRLWGELPKFAAEFGEDAVAPLMKAISSDDPALRACALEALGLADKDVATEPLINALSDDSQRVRRFAARTLGVIKEVRAVRHLIQALSDPSPDVRYAVVWALSEIGDKAAIEPLLQALQLENKEYVCVRIAEALARYHDDIAVDPLIQAHKRGKLRPRVHHQPYPIVDMLVRIGTKKATDALIKIYREDKSPAVRAQAKRELEKLGKRPKSWRERLFGSS